MKIAKKFSHLEKNVYICTLKYARTELNNNK